MVLAWTASGARSRTASVVRAADGFMTFIRANTERRWERVHLSSPASRSIRTPTPPRRGYGAQAAWSVHAQSPFDRRGVPYRRHRRPLRPVRSRRPDGPCARTARRELEKASAIHAQRAGDPADHRPGGLPAVRIRPRIHVVSTRRLLRPQPVESGRSHHGGGQAARGGGSVAAAVPEPRTGTGRAQGAGRARLG